MPPNPNYAPFVYSEELSKLGYGRPMYIPEPTTSGQIEIGDVGIIEERGSFRRLFNILKQPDDRLHQRCGIPETFTPLDFPDHLLELISHFLNPGAYKSRSVKKAAADAAVGGGNAVIGANASYRYSCSRDTGALLNLRQRGCQEICHNNKIWPRYIGNNVDNWHAYLQRPEFDTTIEQLLIVRGFIKTSAWDIVTWTRSTSDHTVTIAGGAPGYGGIDGSFSVTSGNETDPIHRSWPPHTDPDLPTNAARQIEGESADPTVLAANLPQNQTVFLSYYKVKRRPWFWQKKIEAAAGPHSLPPSPPGDAGGMFEIETESQDEWNDPLDDAFMYIFNHNTTASVACICDEDINCFFHVRNHPLLSNGRTDVSLKHQEWPSDLYDKLVELSPQIEEIGELAMFSIEDMIRKGFAPLAQAANPADPAIAPHIPFNPQSGTIPASGSLMEREDIRGGSITFMDDHRTLEWRHTVLMDQNTNGGTPSPVALTKDGLFVAVGFEDSVVRVWNVADENPQFMLCQHKDTIQCTAFHPDQQLLASSSADCSIILWDFRKSLCLYQSFDDGSQVLSLMFSPDGKIMMTGSENATIRFWDVESIINGVKEPVITKVDVGQGSAVYSIAFTPDSSRAISCVNNGYIWDPRSGELIHEMVGHEGTIWALAISHNGARAATGSEDNTTRIWSIETGAELVTIREHRGAIWSVQFSQDDRYVVSGSYDSTISISSASTGECFHILSGHSSVVQAVACSPIGDLVASGAADGIVKLWDGKRGKLIAELKGHADKIKSLTFSPNCDDLISSSDDGTVRIWSMVNVFRVM